jgi:hypothetical protein
MTEQKNCYTELPVIPYKKTVIPEADVIAYIKTLSYNTEVKRTVYAVAYNETAGFNALINTNAAGIQADNARWRHSWDGVIKGTTVKNENMTGNARRFVVFDKWQSSIDMLAFYINSRGIYVGGNAKEYANINPVGGARIVAQHGQQEGQLLQVDLYTAYLRAWVLGVVNAQPNLLDIKDFTLLYNKAAKIFV